MMIPLIRSYLKLYTSMDVAKLSSFLGMEEAEVKSVLLFLPPLHLSLF